MKKPKWPLGSWLVMSQKTVIFINRALPTLDHIFFMARRPLVCQNVLIVEASWWHPWWHPRRYTTMIKSSQMSLTDNTQHSKGKNIHVPGGIRTPNPSKRSARQLEPATAHIRKAFKRSVENEQTWARIKLNNKILLLSLCWILGNIYCKCYKYFEGSNKVFCWRLVLMRDWQWV